MEAMMRRQPLLWAARGGFFRVVVMVTCRHPQVSRAVFILADFCTYYYDECGISKVSDESSHDARCGNGKVLLLTVNNNVIDLFDCLGQLESKGSIRERMKSKIAWREVPVEKRRSPPENVCLGQVLQEVGSVCKKPKRRNLHLLQLLRAYCDNQYDASSK
jgi:hypothetical protein